MADHVEIELVRIRRRLMEHLGPAAADVWLHQPHNVFDGKTAFDLIEDGKSAFVDVALDQLERLE